MQLYRRAVPWMFCLRAGRSGLMTVEYVLLLAALLAVAVFGAWSVFRTPPAK